MQTARDVGADVLVEGIVGTQGVPATDIQANTGHRGVPKHKKEDNAFCIGPGPVNPTAPVHTVPKTPEGNAFGLGMDSETPNNPYWMGHHAMKIVSQFHSLMSAAEGGDRDEILGALNSVAEDPNPVAMYCFAEKLRRNPEIASRFSQAIRGVSPKPLFAQYVLEKVYGHPAKLPTKPAFSPPSNGAVKKRPLRLIRGV